MNWFRNVIKCDIDVNRVKTPKSSYRCLWFRQFQLKLWTIVLNVKKRHFVHLIPIESLWTVLDWGTYFVLKTPNTVCKEEFKRLHYTSKKPELKSWLLLTENVGAECWSGNIRYWRPIPGMQQCGRIEKSAVQ